MFHGGYPIIRWSTTFALYLKRNEHTFTNNIMRITSYLFLKHFSVNLFMWWHFKTSSSRLFNKLAELALAISNFSHKHKSHFLVPQLYGCAFITINHWILAIFFQFPYVVRKLSTFLTWFVSKWWRVIVTSLWNSKRSST